MLAVILTFLTLLCTSPWLLCAIYLQILIKIIAFKWILSPGFPVFPTLDASFEEGFTAFTWPNPIVISRRIITTYSTEMCISFWTRTVCGGTGTVTAAVFSFQGVSGGRKGENLSSYNTKECCILPPQCSGFFNHPHDVLHSGKCNKEKLDLTETCMD